MTERLLSLANELSNGFGWQNNAVEKLSSSIQFLYQFLQLAFGVCPGG